MAVGIEFSVERDYTLEYASLTISSKERIVISCLKTSMSH